jgi:hypothetical protein
MEVNANNGKLQRTYNELVEYNFLLQKTGEFFDSAQRSATHQQSELMADQSGDYSLENPLLEQVWTIIRKGMSFLNQKGHGPALYYKATNEFTTEETRNGDRSIETSEAWFPEWSCAKAKGYGL